MPVNSLQSEELKNDYIESNDFYERRCVKLN